MAGTGIKEEKHAKSTECSSVMTPMYRDKPKVLFDTVQILHLYS